MRFVVQIAMPVAKKSGSSVHSTHPNPMPEANPGQSCSWRPRRRSRALLSTAEEVSRNRLDDFTHDLLSAAHKPLLALPIFTGQDGFQIPLKVFKVILCSDFPGFHIVHHFPQ